MSPGPSSGGAPPAAEEVDASRTAGARDPGRAEVASKEPLLLRGCLSLDHHRRLDGSPGVAQPSSEPPLSTLDMPRERPGGSERQRAAEGGGRRRL